MSSGGCRPEVAARIVSILMDDAGLGELHARYAAPAKKPEPPPPPPKPKPAPRPRNPEAAARREKAEEARSRRRERARELFQAGRSLPQIAAELNVTLPTVAADVAGLRVRRRILRDPEAIRARQEEAARLFREGWTRGQIAEHLGLTAAMVGLDLRACGIRVSDRSTWESPDSRSA